MVREFSVISLFTRSYFVMILCWGIIRWNAHPRILRIFRRFPFTLKTWSLLSCLDSVSRNSGHRDSSIGLASIKLQAKFLAIHGQGKFSYLERIDYCLWHNYVCHGPCEVLEMAMRKRSPNFLTEMRPSSSW